jgi:Txe/YoeB family toxin of Txe-Axe toxin-antitoxin module
MNVTIDVSEDLQAYQNDLNKLVSKVDKELNSIRSTNAPTAKSKFYELESDVKSCQSYVSIVY